MRFAFAAAVVIAIGIAFIARRPAPSGIDDREATAGQTAKPPIAVATVAPPPVDARRRASPAAIGARTPSTCRSTHAATPTRTSALNSGRRIPTSASSGSRARPHQQQQEANHETDHHHHRRAFHRRHRAGAGESAAPAAEEYNTIREFRSKVFEVHNRDAREIASSVKLLGSGFKGSALSVNDDMHTITVRDFPENVAAIEGAIARLDQPIANAPDIEMKISVLIGSKTPLPGAATVPDDLAPVVKQLESTLRYAHYGLMTATVQRTKPGNGTQWLRRRRADAPRHDGPRRSADPLHLPPAPHHRRRRRAAVDRHRQLRLLDARPDQRRRRATRFSISPSASRRRSRSARTRRWSSARRRWATRR